MIRAATESPSDGLVGDGDDETERSAARQWSP